MAQRDNRLYAQFTLDYADSAKIAPLSDAAFRAHVRMILWSRRMLTDGHVPVPMAKVFAKPKILDELLHNDPTCPSLSLDGDDYILHDFLEHQSSRAYVEAQSKRNSDNGRSGGLAKAKRVASKSLSENVAKLYTETETETETETTTSNEVVKRKAAKRGDRIHSDFAITSEMREWAKVEAPLVNLDAKLREFIDYWTGVPGEKGVKLDWVATWRNGMRKQQEFAKRDAPASADPYAGRRVISSAKR